MMLLLEDFKDFKGFELNSFLEADDAVDIVRAMARLHSAFWNRLIPVRCFARG
jgi:hypothetical protein